MYRDAEERQPSDGELMKTMAEGDRDALRALWDRHSRPVYSLSVRVLRDPGWAEEVVQDVFLRLWRNPPKYDASRGDLRPWLLTVAHHAAVDGLRSKRGSARARDTGSEALDYLVYTDEDPAEKAWANVQAEHVWEALSELPAAQREVMEFVYFGGLTQAETAEKTDQPLGTVKSRLRLGLKKMRDSLTEIGATE